MTVGELKVILNNYPDNYDVVIRRGEVIESTEEWFISRLGTPWPMGAITLLPRERELD